MYIPYLLLVIPACVFAMLSGTAYDDPSSKPDMVTDLVVGMMFVGPIVLGVSAIIILYADKNNKRLLSRVFTALPLIWLLICVLFVAVGSISYQ